ncbi:N-acetyltransferase 5 [Marasmius crinis-equi]|uniref:N-acetyltransferase 5 n=1 Tax=Marasmius crinis-equi TaxID=585013 RepID=A0ABR3FQC1_9AGAR
MSQLRDEKVGTICCRIESKDGEDNLYLMTMGVLAILTSGIFTLKPYRSRGLGSESLQQILTAAISHSTPRINKIYLHVQVSNDAAKKFYEKHGFKEVGIHKDYYKKISPHDAWILEKTVEHA